MQLQRLRQQATAQLVASASPKLDADVLIAHVLGCSRTWLIAHADDELSVDTVAAVQTLLARRAAGEPVAYLVGQREFWSLPLTVAPSTLIPRPDTERLVELALERIPAAQACRVLDLGTGTGAIALALKQERPQAEVVAVEREPAALALAARNAESLGLALVLHQGNWFAPLPGQRFHVIVSNPPYIAADDIHLSQGDVRFEPRSALVAGADGLDDIRIVVREAPAHLFPGGWLLFEHGYDQGAAVRALLQMRGFAEVSTWTDLGGQERVSGGCWHAER